MWIEHQWMEGLTDWPWIFVQHHINVIYIKPPSHLRSLWIERKGRTLRIHDRLTNISSSPGWCCRLICGATKLIKTFTNMVQLNYFIGHNHNEVTLIPLRTIGHDSPFWPFQINHEKIYFLLELNKKALTNLKMNNTEQIQSLWWGSYSIALYRRSEWHRNGSSSIHSSRSLSVILVPLWNPGLGSTATWDTHTHTVLYWDQTLVSTGNVCGDSAISSSKRETQAKSGIFCPQFLKDNVNVAG